MVVASGAPLVNLPLSALDSAGSSSFGVVRTVRAVGRCGAQIGHSCRNTVVARLVMARPRRPKDVESEARPMSISRPSAREGIRQDLCADPRAFGLTKIAYAVRETLELLSIGRTTLYAVVKRGELTPVKLGKKTLFYATDLAAFMDGLRIQSSASPFRPKRPYLTTRVARTPLPAGDHVRGARQGIGPGSNCGVRT